MSYSRRMSATLISIIALSVFSVSAAPALAQGVPDIRKSAIETPMKLLIRGTPARPIKTNPAMSTIGRADMGKLGIEGPTKSLIGGPALIESLQKIPKSALAPETAAQLPELEDLTIKADKVKPGRIEWHTTFQKAMAASARSGKPVFLFHMMGRLDDRFC